MLQGSSPLQGTSAATVLDPPVTADRPNEPTSNTSRQSADEWAYYPPEPLTASAVGEWLPEHALLAALLRDAADCLRGQGHIHSGSAAERAHERARLAREATRWVRSNRRTPITAFVPVCEALGLDPEATRNALLGSTARRHPPMLKLAS